MFKTTIGLEIHVQLNTKSKMFCGCSNNPENELNEEPNTRVCPVCMGYPGTLPISNIEAVKKTIQTGIALNCTIAEESKFDRKHYFYPDLPKNFQISQYDQPFCKNGKIKLQTTNYKLQTIRINRVHLEEDAGKLVHPEGADYSLVDMNRCGTPLMEIVTEPDIDSPELAKDFLKELRLIVRYLGVSDADMEKGHLRCDANISVQETRNKKQETNTTPIVEIKNMNSFRSVERALKFEEERLEDNFDELKNEKGKQTRSWNENKGETSSMRRKEEASDYRYFPEPDVPPIVIGGSSSVKVQMSKRNDRQIEIDLEEIKKEIPELPEEKRKKYVELGLNAKAAESLVSKKKYAEYFDEVTKAGADPIKVCDYMVNEKAGVEVAPQNMLELLELIKDGQISNKTGKELLNDLKTKKKSPRELVEEKGLTQVSDEGEIKTVIKEVIKENPGPVADVKKGKDRAIGFLVGQVMQKTNGRANPGLVNKLIKEMIQ